MEANRLFNDLGRRKEVNDLASKTSSIAFPIEFQISKNHSSLILVCRYS